MKTVAIRVISAIVVAFVAVIGATTVESWQHSNAGDPRSPGIHDESMTVSSECVDDTACSTTLGDSRRRGGGSFLVLGGALALALAVGIIFQICQAIVGIVTAVARLIPLLISNQSKEHTNLVHTPSPKFCNEQVETQVQFQPNVRVRHPDFGDGTLLDIGASHTIAYVNFDTEDRSRRPVIMTDLQML